MWDICRLDRDGLGVVGWGDDGHQHPSVVLRGPAEAGDGVEEAGIGGAAVSQVDKRRPRLH
jgi:hypothetical protein